MNDIDARAVPVYGGFCGEFLEPRCSRYKSVLSENGVPKVFDTADRAEVEAWRELKKRAFGVIRAEHAHPLHPRQKAERLFKSVWVKGRAIPVEARR